MRAKTALTLPPKPLQPAPQQVWQNQVMSTAPMAQPVAVGAGRGRPAGPATPGQMPGQTGVPAPSAVASLGGMSSSGTSKGFGNTPTATASGKGHQPTTSTAKSASVQLNSKCAYIGP